MTKRNAARCPRAGVRMAAISFVLASAPLLPALDAQRPAPVEPRFTLGVLPYVGVSTTPRETRLPAAPMVGLRLTGNVWTRVSSRMRVATYVGADGAALAVHEPADCGAVPCTDPAELRMNYLATVYGGVTSDLPGLPHFVVFFGRAFPQVQTEFDPVTRSWKNDRFLTWGVGGGLVVVVGNQPFHLEGRFRRDLRYGPAEDDSFEFILGVPLASVGRGR